MDLRPRSSQLARSFAPKVVTGTMAAQVQGHRKMASFVCMWIRDSFEACDVDKVELEDVADCSRVHCPGGPGLPRYVEPTRLLVHAQAQAALPP